MAVPKLRTPATDHRQLPGDTPPAEFDEQRWEALLQMPGVVVRRRDPNQPIEPFEPLSILAEGAMTHEDLMRLLGRRDDDDLFHWLDPES
jgi:hypothetical protein